MPTLPVGLDAAYPDDPSDPSKKLHQQYHDEIHRLHNILTALEGWFATHGGEDLALQDELASHASTGHIALGSTGTTAAAGNHAHTGVYPSVASFTLHLNDPQHHFEHRASIGVAISDEVTAISTGPAKVTFRMPYAMNLVEVRASLTTASTSGVVTVDVNQSGLSILSTKLTVDAGEKTSVSAATDPVVSDSFLLDDAEITVDVDTAGTGAKGLKLWLIGTVEG